MRRALALLTLGLALAATACYAPDLSSGTLQCGSSNNCPDGYRCLTADQTCWKNGESPATGRSALNATSFVGRWIFSKAATVTSSCTDGSTMKSMPDYVDVTTSTTSDLVGSFYCGWQLDIAPNGETATLSPSAMCTTASNDGTGQFTWTAKSFTFTKTGDGAAVLNAHLSSNFQSLVACVTGCSGSCTVDITGALALSK
ncbi:MAG TPA: hypothetical protein VH560_01730 [Polyangia bacterium]|jgi:hypothetical protein|nr:hypothetical protein [Polyangia bacterium]